MKQSLIVLVIMMSTINLYAQLQKGAVFTGGLISFNSQKKSDSKAQQRTNTKIEDENRFLSIRPQIGFLISEKILLGFGVNYEYSSIKRNNLFSGTNVTPSIEKSNVIFLNPYTTQYSKLLDNLFLTTTLNFQIGFGVGEFKEYEISKSDIFQLRINAVPGLFYVLTKKWVLRGSIGQIFYSRKQEKFRSSNNGSLIQKVNNSYGLNFSFNTFSLGIQYYLNNEEKNMSIGSN